MGLGFRNQEIEVNGIMIFKLFYMFLRYFIILIYNIRGGDHDQKTKTYKFV